MKFLYDEPPGGARGAGWSPQADIYCTRSGWVVKFDLAGVKPEDVTVEARSSCIRVTGVRRDSFIEEGVRHHSMEISYSRFERTVTLPCQAEGGSIRTEYREGMLIVILEVEGE